MNLAILERLHEKYFPNSPILGHLCIVIISMAIAGIIAGVLSSWARENFEKRVHEAGKRFNVLPLTSFVGVNGGPSLIWISYRSKLGDTLSPVSLAVFLTFTNTAQNSQTVRAFIVEALTKDDQWVALIRIPSTLGPIFFIAGDFKKASPVKFVDGFLFEKLENHLIRSGESISGWNLFSYPEILRQIAEPIRLRVTITNTANDVWSGEIRLTNQEKNVTQHTTLEFPGHLVDVSSYKRQPFDG